MGSVKDLDVLKKPAVDNPGEGRFVFSDRYSVFDWGEMPDLIDHKGAAIAVLGAFFFEKLEKKGIATHYMGLVENGRAKKLSELENPSNVMEIKLLRVLHPELKDNQYDYSVYREEQGGFLIPLEIIYRNYLPPGSSVFGRLKRGEITPGDLGLKEMPFPNQKLNPPILDVSTKLEVTDRYISWEEAGQISGLSNNELRDLKELTGSINQLVTEEFSGIGLINEDGKIETGFDFERRLMLVDVLGTLDECRFTFEGLPVSKEIFRIHYRDTPWHREIEEAKKQDRQNWKNICTLNPDPLPPRLKELVSHIYCACTNEITDKRWFKDISPLKEIMMEIKEILTL